MRRRWKLWAAVGVCALATATVVLSLREPDDGLDWIRKYGAKETVTRREVAKSRPRMVAVTYEFQFPGPVPKEVEDETNRFAAAMNARTSGREDQRMVGVYQPTNSVFYTRAWVPNWFELQWFKLKIKLGLEPSP